MKVKAIKDYNDLVLNKLIKEGTEFEVSEARAKELSTTNNKAGMVLVEVLEEPKVKKAGAKKNGTVQAD